MSKIERQVLFVLYETRRSQGRSTPMVRAAMAELEVLVRYELDRRARKSKGWPEWSSLEREALEMVA